MSDPEQSIDRRSFLTKSAALLAGGGAFARTALSYDTPGPGRTTLRIAKKRPIPFHQKAVVLPGFGLDERRDWNWQKWPTGMGRSSILQNLAA